MSTPPPSNPTPANWYPDPERPGSLRYWDGTAWTEHRHTPDGPPPPPTAAVGTAPVPARQSSSGASTVLKVAAGVVLGFLALLVGCAVLISGAADEVQEESDKHAITQAELDAIPIGTTRAEVEATLGEPESEQAMESAEVVGSGTSTYDCIYYPEKGDIISSYQLCFDDDVLTSKNAY